MPVFGAHKYSKCTIRRHQDPHRGVFANVPVRLKSSVGQSDLADRCPQGHRDRNHREVFINRARPYERSAAGIGPLGYFKASRHSVGERAQHKRAAAGIALHHSCVSKPELAVAPQDLNGIDVLCKRLVELNTFGGFIKSGDFAKGWGNAPRIDVIDAIAYLRCHDAGRLAIAPGCSIALVAKARPNDKLNGLRRSVYGNADVSVKDETAAHECQSLANDSIRG